MTIFDPEEKTRIVVFHNGALGDFLIAASAIEELTEISTAACVDFWSKQEHVDLLAAKAYTGKCHRPDCSLVACLLQDTLWRTASLPDFLVKADQVFIFGQAGSRIMAERLSKRLSANVFWIQSFPVSENWETHVSQFLRRQLNDLGYPIRGKPIHLVPAPDDIRKAEELLNRLGVCSPPILVHPGSGGRRKVWPLRYWRHLIEWMRIELSFQVLLSVGPADECLHEFSRFMQDSGVPVVSDLSAARLSGLLSLCRLYTGSDSGVSHLAAAVGIPVIAVFGPTDPRVWGPRGKNVVALRKTWEDSDVLEWTPNLGAARLRYADGPNIPAKRISFPDREIADLILAMVHDGTPRS